MVPRGAEAHTVFRVPGGGGGRAGRASAPEPARGRSGPHRRPACHAGSSGLEGAARSRPQLRPGDKPEGRGQPDPRGPLGSAEAGVQMRSGAQGTATLASKGGRAQGGAQGRAQGKAQGRVRGSEGAALNPRPDRGRQPASPGEGRGRAGRRQSRRPGQGLLARILDTAADRPGRSTRLCAPTPRGLLETASHPKNQSPLRSAPCK